MILNKRIFIKYWIIVFLFTILNLFLKYHNSSKILERKALKYKYILQWTSDHSVPFNFMGKGIHGFLDRKCPYTNCYVTSNKSYFGDNYTKFDVIVFNGPDLVQHRIKLPEMRSASQKFVFASIESSDNYPLCSMKYDNYFNWTWTFRLDSDLRWGYIVVRDVNNKVIGPSANMLWLKSEDMTPVSEDFKEKLRSKTKIAAWFASNCETTSNRERVVENMQKELLKYNKNYIIDIFGRCGNLACSRDYSAVCNRLIKQSYYFYLAFENSLSEDYVTEKLLNALQNNAVPVVYGGANYTRFMPDGTYLDATWLDPASLAKKMHELMTDFDKYADYFKWKNHYFYQRTDEDVETNEYCKMCELLNDDQSVTKVTERSDFVKWWNGIQYDENCWEYF